MTKCSNLNITNFLFSPKIETKVVKIKRTRHKYPLEMKLEVIKAIRPGIRGFGLKSISKKYGLDHSTVKGWLMQREKIEKSLSEKNKNPDGVNREESFDGPWIDIN